jgi:alpha-L-rhamnosidase
VGADTPKGLIATAFFAYSAQLAAELAAELGREEDARRYERLHARVRRAFRGAFVEGGGLVTGETQTGYVLALHLGLLEPDERPRAAARLVDDIEARDWHLSTGFLGVSWLLPALTANGHLDVAYRLLLRESYPSWLFPVRHGATTMWERWDSWSEHMGFQDPAMNSFNHYAYGAVGDWLYRTVAGIDAAAPGYAEITIRPRPGGGLEWARGSYESVRGRIASSWRYRGDAFELEVEIPASTTAVVHVPTTDASAVTEGDGPAGAAEGVSPDGTRDGAAVFRVGSGAYRFRAPV